LKSSSKRGKNVNNLIKNRHAFWNVNINIFAKKNAVTVYRLSLIIGTMVRNTISMAKRAFTYVLQIRLFLLLLLIKNLTRCFYIFLLYNKRKGLLCSLLCCKNIIYEHTELLFLVIILSNLLYPVMEAIFYPSYYFHSVLGPIRWQDYTSTEWLRVTKTRILDPDSYGYLSFCHFSDPLISR